MRVSNMFGNIGIEKLSYRAGGVTVVEHWLGILIPSPVLQVIQQLLSLLSKLWAYCIYDVIIPILNTEYLFS